MLPHGPGLGLALGAMALDHELLSYSPDAPTQLQVRSYCVQSANTALRILPMEDGMARIPCYRELKVWQMAMDLAVLCYRSTEKFPNREHFGLAAHVRKTSVSIASNIAEGHNRSSRAAYRNHVAVALGSQAELETQIELSCRLALLDRMAATELMDRAGDVGRLLHRLLAALDTPAQ